MGLFSKLMSSDPIDATVEMEEKKIRYMNTKRKVELASDPACHPNNLRWLYVWCAEEKDRFDCKKIDEAIAQNPNCPAKILKHLGACGSDTVKSYAQANPNYGA